MKISKLKTLVILVALTNVEKIQATIINVPADQLTIQDGIESATMSDTILVQPGTYIENINFNGKNIVVGSLFITTNDTNYIDISIIDGNYNGSVVTFENGENNTAVLSGFTIKHGQALRGAGIYCYSSSPTVENVVVTSNRITEAWWDGGGGIKCLFSNLILRNTTVKNNTVDGFHGYGGGIFLEFCTQPIFENINIIGNNSELYGGGIYINFSSSILNNVTVKNNTSHIGAGIKITESNSILTNVNITGNETEQYGFGGGMSLSSSNIVMSNVNITNNSAHRGGGIVCGLDIDLSFCTNVNIIGNSANFGGGISVSSISTSNTKISNMLIAENYAYYGGGGIYCNQNNRALVSNVSMTGNTSTYYGGGGLYCSNGAIAVLVNSILWDNSPQEVYFPDFLDSNTITIAYSDLQGGFDAIETNNNGTVNWLDGNIDSDPLFLDPENGDYHLQESSPCIDAGITPFVLEGDTIVNLTPEDYNGLAPDMGVFEFGTVSIADNPLSTSSNFSLHNNYPNPFNPQTSILISLKDMSTVDLVIYNLLGKEIIRLAESELRPAGYHNFIWRGLNRNGKRVASGVYFYTIRIKDISGNYVMKQTKKMIMLE